jgi:hypothetical protein
VREGYDIANLPVLFSKLGWGRGFSSLRSSFELLITINHKTYTTMNYLIIIFSVLLAIAKLFFFAAATYLIYLYIKDKWPKSIPDIKKLRE